jgi:hypothetical protein
VTKKQARYQQQVQKCAAEIRGLLPELADRHTPLVVVAALTEHIGGALFLSQETRACSPARARGIIRRVKQLAFADTESSGTKERNPRPS